MSKEVLIIQSMLSQMIRLKLLQSWPSVEALCKLGESLLKLEDMDLFLLFFDV